jgi:UMF1 family MFS transporter
MYDWAISAFSTTVMAGFFPIFFKDFWSKGTGATDSTFWLGVSVSSASLVISLLAPFLGAIADRGSAKKRSLFLFTLLGSAGTLALFFAGEGQWPLAAVLYAISIIGSLGASVFYDSLIVNVSDEHSVDMLSARGYGLGYLGGGLLFLVNVLMVRNPSWFGLTGPADAVRWSFASVAVWWGLFSLPLFVNVPERGTGPGVSLLEAAKSGFADVRVTVRKLAGNRAILLFLVAYWFYIDGIDTIITMAVDYGKSIGFGTGDLIMALLMVQFVGFPFAYLLGFIAQKWRPKPVILFCIAVYLGVSVLGSRLEATPFRIGGIEINQFFLLAFLIGMVQGGVQSLSRSYFSRMVPEGQSAEFFGFYNMLGRFATIIGPVLLGTVGKLTGNPRLGILSVALLFLIGGALLWRVPDQIDHQRG